MRRQIQKQLYSRSIAIRSAITKYNRLANLLNPPRQTLEINQVLDYAFLAEFDLLKDSRENVHDQPWALPLNREYTQHYFRVQAAKEEIIRLNIEIRRLATAIQDEHSFFRRKIAELQNSDPSLAYAIEQRWNHRNAVNQVHLRNLQKIQKLPGFSGTLMMGKRRLVGQTSKPATETTVYSLAEMDRSHQEMEGSSDGELSEDDEVVEIASALESWHIALE